MYDCSSGIIAVRGLPMRAQSFFPWPSICCPCMIKQSVSFAGIAALHNNRFGYWEKLRALRLQERR